MKTVKSTITSKNQVTIPAKIVRNLNLHRNRQLQIKQRGNSIIITPAPSLEESLKPIWEKADKRINKPLTEEELKKAARQYGTHQTFR